MYVCVCVCVCVHARRGFSLSLLQAHFRPYGPELARGHRVSRPRGTGSVGDIVGESAHTHTHESALCMSPPALTRHLYPYP